MPLKISIITVCLDNEHLKRTIDSVLHQTYSDYELLIIDGKSTNSTTLQVLNEHQNSPKVIIKRERDTGIYDAMNKGIKLASGCYLIFLNAGDYFHSTQSLEFFVAEHGNYDIVYGDLFVIEHEKNWVKHYPDKLSFKYFLKDTLPHPSSFIKKQVFEKVGLYETKMLISADWALFIKAICLQNISYKYIPHIISAFYYDGISSKPYNQELIWGEKSAFLQKEFGLFIADLKDDEQIRDKYLNLKNSRLRKYLSFFFKQLKL